MTTLDKVVIEMIRMDLKALAKRTGLDVPRVSDKNRIDLNRLFVTAVIGQIEEEKLKEWKLV